MLTSPRQEPPLYTNPLDHSVCPPPSSGGGGGAQPANGGPAAHLHIPLGYSAHVVKLDKPVGSPLGLSLIGAADDGGEAEGYFKVRKVLEHGACKRDGGGGRVLEGDVLMIVNGHHLKGLAQMDVVNILRRPSALVTLLVLRPKQLRAQQPAATAARQHQTIIPPHSGARVPSQHDYEHDYHIPGEELYNKHNSHLTPATSCSEDEEEHTALVASLLHKYDPRNQFEPKPKIQPAQAKLIKFANKASPKTRTPPVSPPPEKAFTEEGYNSENEQTSDANLSDFSVNGHETPTPDMLHSPPLAAAPITNLEVPLINIIEATPQPGGSPPPTAQPTMDAEMQTAPITAPRYAVHGIDDPYAPTQSTVRFQVSEPGISSAPDIARIGLLPPPAERARLPNSQYPSLQREAVKSPPRMYADRKTRQSGQHSTAPPGIYKPSTKFSTKSPPLRFSSFGCTSHQSSPVTFDAEAGTKYTADSASATGSPEIYKFLDSMKHLSREFESEMKHSDEETGVDNERHQKGCLLLQVRSSFSSPVADIANTQSEDNQVQVAAQPVLFADPDTTSPTAIVETDRAIQPANLMSLMATSQVAHFLLQQLGKNVNWGLIAAQGTKPAGHNDSARQLQCGMQSEENNPPEKLLGIFSPRGRTALAAVTAQQTDGYSDAHPPDEQQPVPYQEELLAPLDELESAISHADRDLLESSRERMVPEDEMELALLKEMLQPKSRQMIRVVADGRADHKVRQHVPPHTEYCRVKKQTNLSLRPDLDLMLESGGSGNAQPEKCSLFNHPSITTSSKGGPCEKTCTGGSAEGSRFSISIVVDEDEEISETSSPSALRKGTSSVELDTKQALPSPTRDAGSSQERKRKNTYVVQTSLHHSPNNNMDIGAEKPQTYTNFGLMTYEEWKKKNSVDISGNEKWEQRKIVRENSRRKSPKKIEAAGKSVAYMRNNEMVGIGRSEHPRQSRREPINLLTTPEHNPLHGMSNVSAAAAPVAGNKDSSEAHVALKSSPSMNALGQSESQTQEAENDRNEEDQSLRSGPANTRRVTEQVDEIRMRRKSRKKVPRTVARSSKSEDDLSRLKNGDFYDKRQFFELTATRSQLRSNSEGKKRPRSASSRAPFMPPGQAIFI